MGSALQALHAHRGQKNKLKLVAPSWLGSLN